MNRQIVLVSRPAAMPEPSNFELRQGPMPELAPGEVLVRTLYLSVDPYMRGRMSERKSYIPPFQLGMPLSGSGVGQVVSSQSELFQPGDLVSGHFPWADYNKFPAQQLTKADPTIEPLTAHIGVLGAVGLTAYFGLLDIGQPKPGETVVVSGAAGAVGSVVGQLAKLKGCRTIGIAGGKEKVRYLTEELGYDQAIDYKDPSWAQQIKDICGSGVDIYFDNVGGVISDAVFEHLNRYARVALCGQIAHYNQEKPELGPRLMPLFLVRSVLVKGFIVIDYAPRFAEGVSALTQWYREGKLKYRETVAEGLESAPGAFMGLFRGENIGKQIVHVASL